MEKPGSRTGCARLLAIDPGARRVGLAISDPLGWTVRPLETLEGVGRRGLLRRLRQILDVYQIELIVLGLPLNMDGSEGPAAEKARSLARYLGRRLPVMVELWDERLTTIEAQERRQETPAATRRAHSLDAVAAAVLLEDYLACTRSTRGGRDPD